jgi:hypothetical protein
MTEAAQFVGEAIAKQWAHLGQTSLEVVSERAQQVDLSEGRVGTIGYELLAVRHAILPPITALLTSVTSDPRDMTVEIALPVASGFAATSEVLQWIVLKQATDAAQRYRFRLQLSSTAPESTWSLDISFTMNFPDVGTLTWGSNLGALGFSGINFRDEFPSQFGGVAA